MQAHRACRRPCDRVVSRWRPPLAKIVFISRQRLTGRINGSSAYVLDLARAVRSAGMVPVLVQPSPSIMGRTPVARLSPDMDVFAGHHVRGVARIGSMLVSLDPATYLAAARGAVAALGRRLRLGGAWTRDRPLPYSVAIPWMPADHAFVRRHLAGAGILIADYVFQADAFPDAPDAATPTAIVMHDLFHARDASVEAGSGREAVATIDAAAEAAMLARADAVIAIQRTEAEWVARHVPGVRALLTPIAVEAVAAPQPGEEGRLLFVGSNTSPNIVGLRWFLDDVWPEIRRRAPGALLDVVGSVRRSFPTPVDGVTFHGMVDSLDDAYARAAVVVSPLTAGSGLKIKLVEALAHGKAIVATSITLQGVEAECAGAVAVADSAEDFARATAALLDDATTRAALASRALAAAQSHFSADACHAPFVAWMKEVAVRPAAPPALHGPADR